MMDESKKRNFVDYVKKNYPDTEKIIEVGIGKYFDIYDALDFHLEAEIVSIDIKGKCDFVDDITDPCLEIYEESDLIYAVRPPMEIQKHIAELCQRIKSDFLLIPFKGEVHDLSEYFRKFRLKNIEELVFYEGIS